MVLEQHVVEFLCCTWFSILISESVSLSRRASTRTFTPAPVIKLVSRFKLFSVLFSRSMSEKACSEHGEKHSFNKASREPDLFHVYLSLPT